MCMEILPDLLHDRDYLDRLFIPSDLTQYLEKTLEHPTSILGRMDFCYDGVNPPMLLEYNADTPAILYETAFYQMEWLDHMIKLGEFNASTTQYNNLQNDLIASLKSKTNLLKKLYFTCYEGSQEDLMTVEYFSNCAKLAGISTEFCYFEDLTPSSTGEIYDKKGLPIQALYKLSPWEWLLDEPKYTSMLHQCSTHFIEPFWKLLFSNKLLLTKLWERFRGSTNLLPAYTEDNPSHKYIIHDCVRKPVYSREGENIQIITNNTILEQTSGPYTETGFIYQKRYHHLNYDNNYAIIGVWIIDGRPSALGVLEQHGSTIINKASKFVPHIVNS